MADIIGPAFIAAANLIQHYPQFTAGIYAAGAITIAIPYLTPANQSHSWLRKNTTKEQDVPSIVNDIISNTTKPVVDITTKTQPGPNHTDNPSATDIIQPINGVPSGNGSLVNITTEAQSGPEHTDNSFATDIIQPINGVPSGQEIPVLPAGTILWSISLTAIGFLLNNRWIRLNVLVLISLLFNRWSLLNRWFLFNQQTPMFTQWTPRYISDPIITRLGKLEPTLRAVFRLVVLFLFTRTSHPYLQYFLKLGLKSGMLVLVKPTATKIVIFCKALPGQFRALLGQIWAMKGFSFLDIGKTANVLWPGEEWCPLAWRWLWRMPTTVFFTTFCTVALILAVVTFPQRVWSSLIVLIVSFAAPYILSCLQAVGGLDCKQDYIIITVIVIVVLLFFWARTQALLNLQHVFEMLLGAIDRIVLILTSFAASVHHYWKLIEATVRNRVDQWKDTANEAERRRKRNVLVGEAENFDEQSNLQHQARAEHLTEVSRAVAQESSEESSRLLDKLKLPRNNNPTPNAGNVLDQPFDHSLGWDLLRAALYENPATGSAPAPRFVGSIQTYHADKSTSTTNLVDLRVVAGPEGPNATDGANRQSPSNKLDNKLVFHNLPPRSSLSYPTNEDQQDAGNVGDTPSGSSGTAAGSGTSHGNHHGGNPSTTGYGSTNQAQDQSSQNQSTARQDNWRGSFATGDQVIDMNRETDGKDDDNGAPHLPPNDGGVKLSTPETVEADDTIMDDTPRIFSITSSPEMDSDVMEIDSVGASSFVSQPTIPQPSINGSHAAPGNSMENNSDAASSAFSQSTFLHPATSQPPTSQFSTSQPSPSQPPISQPSIPLPAVPAAAISQPSGQPSAPVPSVPQQAASMPSAPRPSLPQQADPKEVAPKKAVPSSKFDLKGIMTSIRGETGNAPPSTTKSVPPSELPTNTPDSTSIPTTNPKTAQTTPNPTFVPSSLNISGAFTSAPAAEPAPTTATSPFSKPFTFNAPNATKLPTFNASDFDPSSFDITNFNPPEPDPSALDKDDGSAAIPFYKPPFTSKLTPSNGVDNNTAHPKSTPRPPSSLYHQYNEVDMNHGGSHTSDSLEKDEDEFEKAVRSAFEVEHEDVVQKQKDEEAMDGTEGGQQKDEGEMEETKDDDNNSNVGGHSEDQHGNGNSQYSSSNHSSDEDSSKTTVRPKTAMVELDSGHFVRNPDYWRHKKSGIKKLATKYGYGRKSWREVPIRAYKRYGNSPALLHDHLDDIGMQWFNETYFGAEVSDWEEDGCYLADDMETDEVTDDSDTGSYSSLFSDRSKDYDTLNSRVQVNETNNETQRPNSTEVISDSDSDEEENWKKAPSEPSSSPKPETLASVEGAPTVPAPVSNPNTPTSQPSSVPNPYDFSSAADKRQAEHHFGFSSGPVPQTSQEVEQDESLPENPGLPGHVYDDALEAGCKTSAEIFKYWTENYETEKKFRPKVAQPKRRRNVQLQNMAPVVVPEAQPLAPERRYRREVRVLHGYSVYYDGACFPREIFEDSTVGPSRYFKNGYDEIIELRGGTPYYIDTETCTDKRYHDDKNGIEVDWEKGEDPEPVDDDN
ncbi:Atrophin-1 multi-domain protein [Pyrenophora tritici-repentis]|nr:Atrophin-1 multi-domain protein [Pyrenophora tritici-repentis]PZC91286.1 Herpes-BLLF1 multi-domain protein [Pyrenophora tritici-repentis]PZD34809.1 Herpes-BLLF1 multi-domain protein [Pyrenophora tritici-repentis]